MELVEVKKPIIPKDWDYDESVKTVKTFVYKWKNLTTDIISELYVAREKLSEQERSSVGTFVPMDKTWSNYCVDIDTSRQVVNRWLDKYFPQVKTIEERDVVQTTRVNTYDSNMLYFSRTYDLKDVNVEGDILCIDVTHGEKEGKKDIRVYKEYYPTVLNVCTFLHPNGKEFSLRDYANIQDFPIDFKFVGTSNEIKRQIGEAVSPKMAEYVINKYIKGTSYIELFAGCGGFSVGAEKLNKKCVWCVDVNKYSGHSFKLNFPDTEVVVDDIQKIDEDDVYNVIGEVDFIIGGPPCQGFSNAGKRLKEKDERNYLYLDFNRFLKCFKPKQFIMENVKEILDFKDEIIKKFEEVGYDVEYEKVNGLDIGMKQKRIRVFFVGNRKND
jgi:site-specific DNA-cytosine methylase|tara:strand:+ start:44 stop:1195 length:1152 start_codon:yes stop_codon:yes gene_type:complete